MQKFNHLDKTIGEGVDSEYFAPNTRLCTKIRSLQRCRDYMYGQCAFSRTCVQVKSGAFEAVHIKELWARAISFAKSDGTNAVLQEWIAIRRLAEELLNGSKCILRVRFEVPVMEHVLWKNLREFLGVTPGSLLLMLVWLHQTVDGSLCAEIMDMRTGRSTDVNLRSLMDASRTVQCDALVFDAGCCEPECWIDPVLGHPHMVNGVRYNEFLEWASAPLPDDVSIRLSLLHAHDMQLSAEPGLNPIFAPLSGIDCLLLPQLS